MAEYRVDLGIISALDKIYTKYFLRDFSYLLCGFVVTFFPFRHWGVYDQPLTIWLALFLGIGWLSIALSCRRYS